MAQQQRQQTEIDARRGIQNTEVRFTEKTQKRLLREQLLESANDERFEHENDEIEQNIHNEEALAYADALEEIETQERIAQMRSAQHAMATAKQTLTEASPLAFGRAASIGILITLALIQLIFSIVSATALGIEAARMTACEETIVGQIGCTATGVFSDVIEFATGFELSSLLPFTYIGWGAWGLIFFITIVIVLYILITGIFQGSSILTSSNSIFITALVIAMNLTPILNLFPWIELWAGYWLLKGVINSVPGLSSIAKKI